MNDEVRNGHKYKLVTNIVKNGKLEQQCGDEELWEKKEM